MQVQTADAAAGALASLVELLVPRSESTFQMFLLLLAGLAGFLGALYILRPVIVKVVQGRQKERADARREREAQHDADVEERSFGHADHERRIRALESVRVHAPDHPNGSPPVSPPTVPHD